jgi:Protein of unknown function (DUF3467)
MNESDDTPPPGEPERDVVSRFDVPEEWRVGLYANNVNVWHSPYEFTLDFAVTEPPEAEDPEDPTSPLTVPNSVVARIRIPVGLVFDVIRAINASMSSYEGLWGEIRRPELRQEDDEE